MHGTCILASRETLCCWAHLLVLGWFIISSLWLLVFLCKWRLSIYVLMVYLGGLWRAAVFLGYP